MTKSPFINYTINSTIFKFNQVISTVQLYKLHPSIHIDFGKQKKQKKKKKSSLTVRDLNYSGLLPWPKPQKQGPTLHKHDTQRTLHTLTHQDANFILNY